MVYSHERCEAPPISAGPATELSPVARVVRLRLFGGRLRATWKRPAGVRVRTEAGERWLPVRDPTRRAQIAIWAAALAVVGFVIWRREVRR